MSSTEFPSNRYSDRPPADAEEDEPKPKAEKIVEGEVIKRKPSLGKRFKDTFMPGDIGSVWGFVTYEVLVPAAKDALADAVSQGIERMIFGEARSTSRRTGRHPGSQLTQGMRTNYNEYAKARRTGRRPAPTSRMSQSARASHNFDEIILSTRVEADQVLDGLYTIVSKYETATVADLYDLVGVTGEWTDDKWGWKDLRGSGITRVRHGYLLDLPRPEPID